MGTKEEQAARQRTNLQNAKARDRVPLPAGGAKLRERYGIDPFSVIRMDKKPWHDSNKQWLQATGVNDSAGRGANCTRNKGWDDVGPEHGTSKFPFALAEAVCRFFAPSPSLAERPVVVLDPCCGVLFPHEPVWLERSPS